MTMDAAEFGRELAQVVRAAVAAAVTEVREELRRELAAHREQIAEVSGNLTARLAALETREPPAVPTVEDVARAATDLLAPMIREALDAGMAGVEVKVASAEGELSATLAALTERVAAVEARPEPPAPPTVDDVAAAVEPRITEARHSLRDEIERETITLHEKVDALTERLAAVEQRAPEKGEKGDPGERGADGVAPTVDDVLAAMADRIEARMAAWALDFERRAQATLERAVDRLPKPKDGKDGRDALQVEDFFAELGEDGRTVTLGLRAGEHVVSRTLRLPTVLDRGVFAEGTRYERHDAVTYGGSVWIAQADDPQGKPGTSADWRLAVKAGRPGRDGRVTVREDKPVKLGGGGA